MKNIFAKLERYFGYGWQVAVLDTEAGRWVVSPKTENIAYLKAENANGRHIVMQPDVAVAANYLLVDDIDETLLQFHHRSPLGKWKPGRLVVETSPKNFQVWIHSDRPLSLAEKRYWLEKMKSDPGADPNNRWGRCPGFRNRKQKHWTHTQGFPLARLVWVDWMKQAKIPIRSIRNAHQKRLSHQPPGGGVCLHPISRNDYNRGDESATDFAYALALLRRGYPRDFVIKSILAERVNWNNHLGGCRLEKYIERTIGKAESLIRS